MQMIEVKTNLEKTNVIYKAQAHKKRRSKEFSIGELVMAHLSKRRTPAGSYSKLQDMKIGPCKTVKKAGSNTYLLDQLDICKFQLPSMLLTYMNIIHQIIARCYVRMTPNQNQLASPPVKKELFSF